MDVPWRTVELNTLVDSNRLELGGTEEASCWDLAE
jgi:hypothetical protein